MTSLCDKKVHIFYVMTSEAENVLPRWLFTLSKNQKLYTGRISMFLNFVCGFEIFKISERMLRERIFYLKVIAGVSNQPCMFV